MSIETIILGVDPGSVITGYGVIAIKGKQYRYLTSGCIRVGNLPLEERLAGIFNGIQEIIRSYNPTHFAIEEIFFHKNPQSALKLGQARGTAIAASAVSSLSFSEYSAKQIKQAVVGYGGASKAQVQHMVKELLSLTGAPQADAADALAVALCHHYMSQGLQQMWSL